MKTIKLIFYFYQTLNALKDKTLYKNTGDSTCFGRNQLANLCDAGVGPHKINKYTMEHKQGLQVTVHLK